MPSLKEMLPLTGHASGRCASSGRTLGASKSVLSKESTTRCHEVKLVSVCLTRPRLRLIRTQTAA